MARPYSKGLAMLGGTALVAGLYIASRYNYPLFHALIEMFSVAVAWAFFLIIWNCRQYLRSGCFLFLGIAYLFVGGIDMVHTLAYKGMGVFTHAGTNLPTQLWIAARGMEAAALLVATMLVKRRLGGRAQWFVLLAFAAATCGLLVLIFVPGMFPTAHVEGTGLTTFKVISEYIIAAVLLAAALLFIRARAAFDPGVLRLLVASILVTIMSEMSFTLYIDVYGAANMAGHFLKLVSFGLLCAAVIRTGLQRPYALLFRDLKKTEDELRENERRIEALLNATKDAVLLLDTQGKVVELNETAARGLGASRAELHGIRVFDRFPPDVAAAREEQLRKVVRLKQPLLCEDAAGPKYFESSLCPLFNSAGEVSGVAVFARNVTERKLAEEQLRAMSARNEALLAAVPDIIMEVDVNRVYTWANQAGRKFFGDDVLGHEAAYYFEGEQDTYDKVQPLLEGSEDVIYVESWQRRKDGEKRLLAWWCRVLKNGDGRVTGALSTARDITERKRAQETLLQHYRLNQMLLDTLPCVTLLLRPHTREIVLANEAGRKAGAVPGKTCFEAWMHRDTVCPWCLAPKVWAGQGPQHLEVEYGDVVWDAHWYPVSEDLYLHYAFDITDRKRAEEEHRKLEGQILHAQKLESLGVLAGVVAHDFNNLLTAILGNADVALDALPEESPVRVDIQEIETASRRAAELCRELLAYSGRGQFVTEQLDLSTLVDEMGHLCETAISKKVSLKCDLADNLPAVAADATQLRQVVMNLIINASEAIGDESGVITICTGIIQADRHCLSTMCMDEELPEGAYIFLKVTDTGCGMDEETLSKIFDPFFSTKFTGRGLGLAATLGIVRGHRGAIKVRSTLEKGTTFTLLLPCADKTCGRDAADREEMPASLWLSPVTVLVVDDEEAARNMTRKMLELSRVTPLTAKGGSEAIDIFGKRADEIDAVLLDLTMPIMSGEEVFSALRRIRPDIPIVLCSGYAEENNIGRFTGKGLTVFLHKPYTRAELIARLREVIAPDADC